MTETVIVAVLSLIGTMAGKFFSINETKAGQQELVRKPFSTSSRDSASATMSAPRAASMTVWKPSALIPLIT